MYLTMCYVLNECLPDYKNGILASTEKKKDITIDMRKDDHFHLGSYCGSETSSNKS